MPAAETGFFAALREAAGDGWRDYVEHPFVQGLGDGTLPEAAFRHYLIQDYLFLIQFARAYGLAAYKADTLAEIRAASDGLKALVEVEMDLHRAYCAEWGLEEAALEAADADGATLAYTSYVLERGLAGDLLDLRVALALASSVTERSAPASRPIPPPARTAIPMRAGSTCMPAGSIRRSCKPR